LDKKKREYIEELRKQLLLCHRDKKYSSWMAFKADLIKNYEQKFSKNGVSYGRINLSKNIGKHAGGIVVAGGSIPKFIPSMKIKVTANDGMNILSTYSCKSCCRDIYVDIVDLNLLKDGVTITSNEIFGINLNNSKELVHKYDLSLINIVTFLNYIKEKGYIHHCEDCLLKEKFLIKCI